MTANRLTLHDVGVSFGQFVALNSINIEIPGKGVVALVGHNGSGKSTLLDILSGFLRPSRGHIASQTPKKTLRRSDLIARVTRLHQRLVVPSMLPAGSFLTAAAHKNSFSSLLLPDRSKGIRSSIDDDASSEILRAAGLLKCMGMPLGKLSFGQQRALSLEAVFATSKPFVALDEPLAGLHPIVRDSVLKRIQEEGRSRCILIAEHDLGGALAVANRVVVFRLGNIVADLPSTGITAVDLVTML